MPFSMPCMTDSRNWFRPIPAYRRRRLPLCRRIGGVQLNVGDRDLINFASNDYLGLASHPDVKAAARGHIGKQGLGSGGSRLISGDAPELHELESVLATWKGYEAALVAGSGYLANVGLIDALASRDALLFCDRLNHASLVDGARLSRARVFRYAHRDMNQLEALLQSHPCKHRLIVSDGVFSMNGDCAPVREMLALAERYDALLIIDDAHGTGVIGPEGRGLLAEHGISGHPRLLEVGTMGKALGGYGAFILGASEMIDGLKQRLRTMIYSTALPPCLAAAATEAVHLARQPDLRHQLRANIEHFLQLATDLEIPLMASCTAIQPIMIGRDQDALQSSASLRDAGFFVPAIRPPTVPEGTARLRITLSAAHESRHVGALMETLACLR